MKLVRATAVLSVGLIASAGCAGRRASGERSWSRPPTSVRVSNQNWMDVVVFTVRGSTRIRVGAVNALSEATLSLSAAASLDGSLQLLLDPIGSERVYVTEAIVVGPGQQVELTIMPALGMSRLAVRAR